MFTNRDEFSDSRIQLYLLDELPRARREKIIQLSKALLAILTLIVWMSVALAEIS